MVAVLRDEQQCRRCPGGLAQRHRQEDLGVPRGARGALLHARMRAYVFRFACVQCSASVSHACARTDVACARANMLQGMGLAWLATSWAACYHVQPSKALGSRFFRERSQRFFDVAERCVSAVSLQMVLAVLLLAQALCVRSLVHTCC